MPEIDNESRKWLYQTLTSPEYGLNLGTPQEFDSLVSNNEESRRWLWDQANSLGLNVGANYEEFDSLINPRVDVSDVQQAEVASQPVTEVAAQPSQQPVSEPARAFQPTDYSPRPVTGAQTEPVQPNAPRQPFQPMDYSPRPAQPTENQAMPQAESSAQQPDTVAQQPQETSYMAQDTASMPQDTVTQPQETPMEAGKPRTVSDIVSDFEQRHHLKEARERIYGKGKAPITVRNGKTGYNFSPENVEVMRGYQEQAWEAAFNEVQSLMPEIERSVREKALFDTEQNNRNKDAKQEDLQWHADRLAEKRMRFIREKLEEGGIGRNGLDFSKESTLNLLSFGDKELREKLSAAYKDKSDIDGYMDAYYRTPEGKAERTEAVNNAEASLQGIREKRTEGFWNTVGAMFGDIAISGAIAEGGMDRQSQQQLLKVQDDIRKTASVNMATNQQLHEAENTLGIVKKNIEEGEGNALVKFGRGVRYSNLDNLIPVSDLYGQMGILQLYDKLDANGNPKEPLTEEEQNLYDALAVNQYVQQVFGGDVNMLNRIGRGLPEQAAFTLQFLLSSEFAGAQAVGKGATNALRRGIGNTIKKEIKSGIGGFMLDKALPTAFGMGAETLYRTGLQLPSIMAGGIERHVGNLRIDPETGKVGGFDGGVDWGEALWKSTLSVANENFTELLGDQVFQPGWEWLGRNTKAGTVLSDFREGLGRLGNNKVDDWLKAGADIRRKAGWAGWAFEAAEEMAGSFNDAAFIHDQTWSEAFSKESVMETVLNCMIFGVVMGTTTSTLGSARNLPSVVETRNTKRKAAAVIDRMEGISTAEIDEHIDNSTSNELADWLVQMHRNGNSNGDWTDAQRAAVANYVRASVAQKAQRHFKGMQLQEDVKAIEATADDMVNNQSGDIIDANFVVDGQQMTGTIVGGRVSAVEDNATDAEGNPRKAFIYNPNLSSVTLTVRLEDGTKKQIPARDVTSINDIVDAEQFKAERASELQGEMQRSVADMDKVTTASDVWSKVLGGKTLQAGMLLPYNGGIVRFDGKDADGNWLVTAADGTQEAINDFEFRKIGMIEGLRMLQQQQAPQEEIDDAVDDIDTEDTLHNIEQSDNEDNIWNDIAGFMQGYVKTNEEGDFVVDESRPEAAAGYLVALQKGDIAKTIDIVNERIAELQTRLMEKPQGVQNNGEGVVGMAANQSLADSAAEDIQKQIDFLTSIRDGLVAKQLEKAEMDAMKPVSQMGRDESFPVVFDGQQATAVVREQNTDGNGGVLVDILDENGDPIPGGAGYIASAEELEGMRVRPQEREKEENSLVKVGDRVDVDWGNGTTETVTVRGIEGDLVLITTSDGKPYGFPIGWLSSGQARVSNNSVEITPAPQGPAPAAPSAAQPVSQNETPEPTSQQTPMPVQPEAAPQQEQPQAEYPKDKQGKPQYDMIEDPNVFAQALVDEWGEDALGALDDIIEDTKEGLELKRRLEQRRINKRLAMLEAVRGMMQPQEEAETPAEEVPAEQPVAETPQEEAPKEEVPSETPMESAGEGTELTSPSPLSEEELGPTDEAVAAANEEVDTNPTEAQKEAGNYKKGHVTIDGFDISIENPAGSTRSGTDAQGNPWSVTMHNSYGYIRMTEGVDGDHIDIFLSDHIDDWNGTVYVVDQVNADGSFDEHKVMYGFNSSEEAREAYLSNYSEGWQGLGTITGVSREEFKKWVDSSHRKTKAFAYYKSVQATEGQNEAALATQQTEQETPIQKPKKQTDFQQRIDAVGEPRSLEEAILLDIARGGAKFRWGNRDEDKTVTKRGIGDLWKYSKSEFKKRIGILRKDGYSIETYAEAIQAGQLAYLGGHVSQLAERMDMRDLVDAIEDVLHFATSATEALEAIETKRNEEAEEEQRMIQNAMDSEAKEQGFENWADKEAYIQSLEENNLTDDDYDEITRIFAEQYQEDEQRRRTSESEGDSAENQPDERQGVRGADEGGTEVLQGTQAADTGTAEPAGQSTRGESGDIQDAGTPGKNEGAREVRAEIDKLKAQRANLVKQLNDLQKRYENANGLFGDTQADEGDLFGGQNFLSPELAQTTIEGYKRQIKQIDEQIAKLEASLKRASSVKQTEIGGEETKPQWDYDIKIDQKTGHTTIERYTQIEGGMPIFDARWKLEADSPAEMLGIITNPRNGLNVDYFKKFIDILRSYGDRYTTKKDETKKEEPKKNEPQGAATENTIFTEDEYQRRKEALKRRHRTELNIAINPQDFEDLLYMAGYHIERGVRKFADFCKSMIEDLGDWVRPYLQTVYLGAKADDDIKKLGIDRKEWSSEDEVLDFDVDNFDKQQESETGAHQYTEQQKRKFSDAVRVDMRMALERGEKPYRSINDIRKRAESLGMEVDSEGRDDIMLQELVEDGLVRAAREVVESGRYGGAKSKDAFDAICQLYEMQPTISRRSANRVKMGQYSTPLPMSFVADMFAYRRGQKSVLEPTAGNGMLVFAVPAGVVTANELDDTRLANLREQGFKEVTNSDATDTDFGGPFDAVIGNPPFGSAEAKEYDGVMIGGLEEQIVLNALQAMADNGRAAFIIGGNMEYAKNGGIAGNKAFWTYLYNHYNVKGVVDMDGKMFSRQGTTFPTRMILIDGRRSAEEIAQSTIYPPVKEKSLRKAESFVDLYDIVKELNDSTNKTNGTEILRTPGAPVVPDSNRPSGETSTQRPRVEPNANVANEQGGPVGTGSTGGTGQTATTGVQRPATTGGTVDVGQRPASVSGTQTSQSGSGTRTDNGNNGGRGQAVLEGSSNGKTGRVPDGGVSRNGDAVQRMGLTQKPHEQEKRTLTEEKLPYRPHNSAFSLESVAQAAMVEAMDKSLAEIEKTYGKSIDEFVTDELGYDSIEEMHNALAAEQVDSVAMAIHQMKQGNGMIIGDQTGVGKGRQMAALIRWAHKQGKKPIFFTKDADLFTDIYRDLVDVGSGDLRPFIFNSPDGEKPGVMVDTDGKIVYKALPNRKQEAIYATGKLPDEYDYAVLSYSQVSTGDAISQEEAKNAARASGKRGAKKSKSDGKPTPKATFLRQIAEDNYLFLDESHTAAGESNTGYYLQSIVRTSKAVTFASATFAKRPDTMPLYAIRTAMSQANVKPNELIGIIQKGGVTLQEIMSRALTEAGQMVRRERDMSDVQTDWETISDPATVKRARENYDKTIEAFNAIIRFQELYIKPLISQLDSELAEVASTANVKKGTNKMGVENTPFASKTYNYTKQLMLALKVDAIVDKVIAEIKAGRHPVIALESTMEASIRDYSPGDIISEPTFSASLLRGLETVMQYTVTDAEGKDTHRRYLPSDLGPEGEKAYYELQDFIRESTSDIFISPLDAIIERLRQEGYKVGELTGRNQYVERNDEGKVVVKRRTDKDKKRMQREFNSGELDVLILNKSASTGISLHASERFSDQRQRTMVIAQPLSDINDYMQMIGRIDRTGQVHRGYYINLGLPVPAENRFLMMLATKLKSLNANTTTSQESESNSVEAPDLLNKYGSQVVVEYLRDNPEIYVKMGEPIKEVTVNQLDDYTPPENDEVVRKITGYVALLSTKEQEDFYNDVVRRYIDLIKYLDDTWQNDLKITVMPLRAKTIERRVSSQGVDPNGTNPFAKDAFVETVEIDVLRKPMKADEVRKTIESLNTPKGIEKGHLPTEVAEKSLGERVMEIIGIVQREAQAKLEDEERRYEESKEKAAADIEKQREKISKQQKRTEAEKAEAIAKLIEEKNAWVEKQHENAVARIQEAERTLISRLNTFRAGQSVLMPDVLEQSQLASPELASPAIFCGFKAKDSKVTASTTFAVFATLDGRRRIEIKLSDGQALYNIRNMANENYDLANRVTLDNWDSEIPTSTRKNAYILTGNILQAVADTQDQNGNYPGQLISYTDENGDVHDGILMPDKWKPTMMKNSGVPINARLSQIEQGKAVASTDGKVTITKSRWSGSWLLTVPKSKKEGAVYFENPVILKVVGGFWQSRGQFAADINSVEDLRTVVNELANIGVKVTGEQNGGVELSVRTEPAPKKTKKVYKLMRLENGKLYPLFIDRNAMPIELGTWYNANSPNVADLESLEAGYAYKIDGNGNVVERKKINRTEKGSITGLPNVKSVNSAADEGARWIAVTTDKSGKKTYHNVGINGSEGVSTYAMRPGWHAGSLPSMRQIGKGPQRNIRDSRFVWVEGEVAADVDYQNEAEQSPTKDIQTHIPTDGYYMKATNADKVKSQADRIGWYISGAFKPNRVISDAEAREVIDEYNAQHPDAPVEYDYEREGGEFTREDAERVNNTAAESKRIAFEAATTALARAGYEVVRATEKDIEDLKKENKLLRKLNGTINGWLGKDGRIYLTESGLNAETAVHEYTHLWAEALQVNDPKLWDEIKTLLKGTPTWNEVKNNPAYAKYDEDRLAEEVLAHLSGRDNGARMEAEAKRMIDEADTMADAAKAASMLNRLKEALKKFWTWVGKKLFGIKGKIDLDTVENMILADLVNGVNPFGPSGGRKKNTTEQSFTPSASENGGVYEGSHIRVPGVKERDIPRGYSEEDGGYYIRWHRIIDPRIYAQAALDTWSIPERTDAENIDGAIEEIDDEITEHEKIWARLDKEESKGFLKTIEKNSSMKYHERKLKMLKKAKEILNSLKSNNNSTNPQQPNNPTPTPLTPTPPSNPAPAQPSNSAGGQGMNMIADEYNRMTGANVDGVNGVKRRWEKIARDMFDGLRPLEQMQQLIEKALGRKLRDSEKAYELATQLTSKTGQQIDKEQLSYMVPVLQKVTDIIKLITEFDEYSIEEAYKMVTNYLLAKHGLERNEWFEKQGKKEGDYAGLRGLAESLGENPDDFKAVAERVVNGFEQLVNYNYYGVHTDNLWKTMKALTDRMLEISYDTGMIDKETFEELKKRHKYYVPLRGFADGTAADLFDYVTQSPHFQNIFKKATGRNSMADDPLANLMSMLHSAIVIGNQNEVMQKIYNLAVNSKSDLLRVTKPWYVYDDTTDTWEEKYPDIPEDATADEIDAIVKQFDADMQQKQQQGKAKRKLNRIDVGKKLLPYQAREHEMVAYIDGKRVVMHVAGNPLVAQSMNKSNTQQLNKVMQAIQTATRWYSSINTSWSPAFGPKNAMRDIRMMLFGAYVTGGIRKMWQSSKDVVKAGWALPRLLVTGKMDGGLVKALGPQKAAQLEQWWNEFIDNGGETGFTRTLNAEKAKGEVRDMIRHMLNGSKDGENRVRKYTIGLLEWIGRYSEDISRFAAYCQQRAQGESVLSSIQEAKNVTVNFNVKGGSDLAANMRAMYSFFNASMQGINRMRRLATEHPKRFSSGIAAMMLGGAVLPWLNMALFAMLGGDDDDWRKYEYLSEYTANHNMIIYVGNHKFVSIPWSQELAPFNALGNIWFRQQMGWNKGKSVAEQWGDMFVDLSPISVASGNKPGVGLVKTIMPSFTTPIWEALFNEDFTGSPLYKDNQWNKYDKGWEKAYEGKTSKSVIDASRWLEEKTGIDINPAIAEHLFSGVLGGMGRSGDKLLRYFTNGFQLQDAPFIRTMMFDSKKQGYIGAVQREYGRNAYEVLPEMKAKAEKADAMEFARLVNTEEYKIADVVSKYKTGKDLEGNKTGEVGIDKMEKEYKKIAGMSDGSEEYREQLEEIRNNITERKMEMLDEIQQVKYENSGDLRRYIMDVVNEVERKSKERNGD